MHSRPVACWCMRRFTPTFSWPPSTQPYPLQLHRAFLTLCAGPGPCQISSHPLSSPLASPNSSGCLHSDLSQIEASQLYRLEPQNTWELNPALPVFKMSIFHAPPQILFPRCSGLVYQPHRLGPLEAPEQPWPASGSGAGRDINHKSIIWSQFGPPYGGPYSPWYGDLYGSIHGQWSTAPLGSR